MVDLITERGQVVEVLVRFDASPSVVQSIKRVSADVMIAPGLFVSRQQFPLILAYGLTIHKCQGY